MKKHVVLVAGTRPEVLKLWSVAKELGKFRDLKTSCVNTGQQKNLTKQAADDIGFHFHTHLNVMRPNQSLPSVISRLTASLEKCFYRLKPDLVIVQGDTVTAFSAALTAFYQRIPVAHVEAGLRTWNRWEPFPEESNRVFVDYLADLHFAPTEFSKKALNKERIYRSIFVTGNTIVDLVQSISKKVSTRSDWPIPYVLVTLHRRENFARAIMSTARVLERILQKYPNLHVVWPVHPNPNVRKGIPERLRKNRRCHLIDPLPYRSFIRAMKHSKLIISDSGGVQEEAPTLRKRVVVIRNRTERPEAVAGGWCILAGTDPKKIERRIDQELKSKKISRRRNPFGDGFAGEEIAREIRRFLLKNSAHRFGR